MAWMSSTSKLRNLTRTKRDKINFKKIEKKLATSYVILGLGDLIISAFGVYYQGELTMYVSK